MNSKLPDYCHEIRCPKLVAVHVVPALWGTGLQHGAKEPQLRELTGAVPGCCGERTPFKLTMNVMLSETSLTWWEERAHSTIVIGIFII